MNLKFIEREDFVNYRTCSMFLGFPCCTFKCDRENGTQACQNLPLCSQESRDLPVEEIYNSYMSSDVTRAIVCGGLEPLETSDDLYELVSYFRSRGCMDDFVIYTGYTEGEVMSNPEWERLTHMGNMVFKFGRFRPGHQPHFDEVLGIQLVSDNQYGKRFD